MATQINYDYMPGMDGSILNGYGTGSNDDLDNILDYSQAEAAAGFNSSGMNMFDFGSIMTPNGMNVRSMMTPNGMNIDGGMMPGSFGENTMFPPSIGGPAQFSNNGAASYDSQSTGYPFPHAVNPVTLMDSTQFSRNQNTQYSSGANENQATRMAHPDVTGSVKRSQENDEAIEPKPKRTRQSKKKKLTVDQEEKKRKEFLERNRQAASKCRVRKQEATATLQAKAHDYSLLNSGLKQQVLDLRRQIDELSGHLMRHSSCSDPELKAGIEHFRSHYESRSYSEISPTTPLSNQSFGSMPDQTMGSPSLGMDLLNSGPSTPTSCEMQRHGSGMSNRSLSVSKAAGTPGAHAFPVMPTQLDAASEKRLQEEEESMEAYRKFSKQAQDEFEAANTYAMIHQNSKASNSSSSSSRNGSSGYISAITTPEDSAKANSPTTQIAVNPKQRRGLTQETLGNPRAESLLDPALPGVSPMDFLTLQQQS